MMRAWRLCLSRTSGLSREQEDRGDRTSAFVYRGNPKTGNWNLRRYIECVTTLPSCSVNGLVFQFVIYNTVTCNFTQSPLNVSGAPKSSPLKNFARPIITLITIGKYYVNLYILVTHSVSANLESFMTKTDETTLLLIMATFGRNHAHAETIKIVSLSTTTAARNLSGLGPLV